MRERITFKYYGVSIAAAATERANELRSCIADLKSIKPASWSPPIVNSDGVVRMIDGESLLATANDSGIFAERIRSLEQDVETMDAWASQFGRNSCTEYELSIDDIVYFGLKG